MSFDRSGERLVALFLLGVLLLTPPFLLLFNRPVTFVGFPLLHLYLFAVWAVLIALAALVVRNLDGAGLDKGPLPAQEQSETDVVGEGGDPPRA